MTGLLLRGVRVVDGRGVRAHPVTPGLPNAHSHVFLDCTPPDPETVLRDEIPAENAFRTRNARILHDPNYAFAPRKTFIKTGGVVTDQVVAGMFEAAVS